ncbi:MAG: Exopolysaccharide biosynthesis polyprenyl glycosylphosphotransferase, partial [uncultured Acidimicrobiales bacterium]
RDVDGDGCRTRCAACPVGGRPRRTPAPRPGRAGLVEPEARPHPDRRRRHLGGVAAVGRVRHGHARRLPVRAAAGRGARRRPHPAVPRRVPPLPRPGVLGPRRGDRRHRQGVCHRRHRRAGVRGRHRRRHRAAPPRRRCGRRVPGAADGPQGVPHLDRPATPPWPAPAPGRGRRHQRRGPCPGRHAPAQPRRRLRRRRPPRRPPRRRQHRDRALAGPGPRDGGGGAGARRQRCVLRRQRPGARPAQRQRARADGRREPRPPLELAPRDRRPPDPAPADLEGAHVLPRARPAPAVGGADEAGDRHHLRQPRARAHGAAPARARPGGPPARRRLTPLPPGAGGPGRDPLHPAQAAHHDPRRRAPRVRPGVPQRARRRPVQGRRRPEGDAHRPVPPCRQPGRAPAAHQRPAGGDEPGRAPPRPAVGGRPVRGAPPRPPPRHPRRHGPVAGRGEGGPRPRGLHPPRPVLRRELVGHARPRDHDLDGQRRPRPGRPPPPPPGAGHDL